MALYILHSTGALNNNRTIWWAVSLTALLLKLLQALLWIVLGEGLGGMQHSTLEFNEVLKD